MIDGKRGHRRARKIAVSLRRRAEHLARERVDIDCACERAVFYFAKRRAFGCRCRGRVAGRPRLSSGICCWVDWREGIYRGRRYDREHGIAVRSGLLAEDDDGVAHFPRFGGVRLTARSRA